MRMTSQYLQNCAIEEISTDADQRLTDGAAGLILRFRCGAIAQLGERLHGMQEVRGSIPRSSTTLPSPVFQTNHGLKKLCPQLPGV